MKLHELGARRPTEQIAKVFESQHGTRVDFDRISPSHAKSMLKKVQELIREHRVSPSFHYSERNPDYMKLVMMEQALAARISEQTPAVGSAAAPAVGTSNVDPAKTAAAQQLMVQQKKRQIQDLIRTKQKEIQDLQRQMNQPMAESRRLHEASEVQQAQVVMAAQDMVDQVQKMMEQISAMQFKDLPALVDAIKNEVGVDQANKFQADATAALSGLLSSVQQGKTQLEAAQGVLTGQAPTVPGDDMDADMNMPTGEPGAELDADLSLDANLPASDEDDEEISGAALGRERR